jgi:thiol-disulfide isomerase/thioredoxin
VGQQAPDFDWLALSGPTRLSALRGHPVLIEFFAPWCGQCQQDVPLLNSFATSSTYKGLQVLSITASPYGRNYETTGSNALVTTYDVDWYRRTFKARYNFIFDPQNRIFNLFGWGQSYPTFYVIDARGVIRFATSTYIQDQDLINHVLQVV